MDCWFKPNTLQETPNNYLGTRLLDREQLITDSLLQGEPYLHFKENMSIKPCFEVQTYIKKYYISLIGGN